MAIPKAKYEELKEYWDYQRKIEYNREVIYFMADKFQNRVYNDMGNVSIENLKKILWERVQPEDYEEPRKGYVPEDENLRIEGEGKPFLPKIMIPKNDPHFKG
tara:strand:- start:225 stop:533 length:309 start_codon:yes stop_codon:yes gene_type:complete